MKAIGTNIIVEALSIEDVETNGVKATVHKAKIHSAGDRLPLQKLGLDINDVVIFSPEKVIPIPDKDGFSKYLIIDYNNIKAVIQ